VAEYNQLTGKSIKKFSSRAAGEKQLEAARKAVAPKKPVPVLSPAKSKGKGKQMEQGKKEINVNRSKAIGDSWNDPAIAEKRTKRDHVSVSYEGNKDIYRSVKEAFEKLGLPLGKHIGFRMILKESKRFIFEHNGKHYDFKIVEQQEVAV
ncbi:MAG TPA: hypothetical protein VFM18_06305, partial [Methanosarcina sp.]|nr:hypothetical protein [Methanosarcina sp.]